jgi:hypothetical protein
MKSRRWKTPGRSGCPPRVMRVVCQGRSSSVISKAAAAVLSLNVCAMIQALGRAKALSSVYTGGMTHIAMPVPASTPITKTAAPIKTRAGPPVSNSGRRKQAEPVPYVRTQPSRLRCPSQASAGQK